MFFSLIFSAAAFAQSGTLKESADKNTGETLPFVNVVVERNGSQNGGTATDFDGYTIKPLDPGTYTIEASYIGYTYKSQAIVSSNKITFQDIKMSEGIDIGEVEVGNRNHC